MATGRKTRLHTRERQRRINRRRVFATSISAGVIAVLAVLLWYGIRIPAFSVGSVSITGTESVSPDDLENRVESLLLGSHFLGAVPYRFIYGIPEDYIRSVVEEMPRIARANISRNGATLIVAVEEHAPEMLWCGATTTTPCFYVDRNGIAYEQAATLSGETLTRFMVTGDEPRIDDSLLSDGVRSILLEIARAMEERHDFRVSRIEYSPDGDAIMSLSGGGIIQMSTSNDLETTYANLASILTSEEFVHLKPGNFERIDLRFGNKVFVQEDPVVASSTATTTSEVE